MRGRVARLRHVAAEGVPKGVRGFFTERHGDCRVGEQAVVRLPRPTVAVGMAVPGHPPHRPVLAGTTAHGYYLGCDAARRLASKRASGKSCTTRGMGSQWLKMGPSFSQLGRR